MAYPDAEVAHKGKKATTTAKLLETKSFSGALLSQARTVLRLTPDNAARVMLPMRRRGHYLDDVYSQMR